MSPVNDVDYGFHWTLPTGQRARLSWNADTGVLYLFHPDPATSPEILVGSWTRETVEALLTGWEDAGGNLAWLQHRLWVVGAHLPEWALR
jgi:hypothetical protein